MTSRVRAACAAMLLLGAGSAQAAELPAIKASATNKVPACVTPGRLGAYVEARNRTLDPRFEKIAVEYMRHGEDLQLRWDFAFFQMLVETGNLTFRRGNGQPGDVKPRQNNFAGLGATGNGEPGESFPDISTGVRAHLQHVLLYSGETVVNPVAERTRKVQEWGILKSWQRTMTRPVTFRDLTIRWSPGDKGYARDIDAVADRFTEEFCDKPDPKPELVAEARRGRANETAVARADTKPQAEPAKQPTRLDTSNRSALGAPPPASAPAAAATEPPVGRTAPVTTGSTAVTAAGAAAAPGFRVINPGAEQTPPTQTPKAESTPTARVEQASAAGGAAKGAAALKPAEPGKCRVWTASYGGQKAIIIRAPAGAMTHFTVLEVNEGSEKKEADAYIAVYARGGQTVGEFPSQEQALDKAFDLCPEG
jgi:hypothetical protein